MLGDYLVYSGGPQIMLSGSQGILGQFPEDSWIHIYNDYFEVYLFFKLKEQCFVKNKGGTY